MLTNNVTNVTNDTLANGGQSIVTYVDAALACLGFLLNFWTVLVISVKPIIPGPIPRFLLLNQCCSDCACCVGRLVWLFGVENLRVPENAFGGFLCRLVLPGTFYWALIHVSVNSLVLFTAEQYVFLVFPMRHDQLTSAKCWLLIGLSWLFSVAAVSGSFLEVTRVGNECTQIALDPVWFKVFGTVGFLTTFLLPLMALAFCYIGIIRTLRASVRTMTDGRATESRSSHMAARRKANQELLYTASFIGGAFLSLFALNETYFYLYALSVVHIDYTHWFYQLTVFMINCYYVVSPLCCMLRLRSFRREMSCKCLREQRQNPAAPIGQISVYTHSSDLASKP